MRREKTVVEKFATLRSGRKKKTVKAWQYYSVFEFLRWQGETAEEADRIAKWCRDKASDGETLEKDGYSITVKEKEIPA